MIVIIIVNFKAYPQSMGKQGLDLVKTCERVNKSSKVTVSVAPQLVDTSLVCSRFSLPVLSQHVDPVSPGAHTGHVLPESVKSVGCVGSLVNHSECRISLSSIRSVVSRLRGLGLSSVVCVPSLYLARKVLKIQSDFIAFEPPKLIGGKVSVSSAQPNIIRDVVKLRNKISPSTKVLVGAGVHSRHDVESSLDLGASGVLIASGVVKSINPEQKLKELISGFGVD